MPSTIDNVKFQEERYIGSNRVFQSGITIDSDDPFSYDITIPQDLPTIEKERILLEIIGSPVTDPDGTIYGGNFRIKTTRYRCSTHYSDSCSD